MELVERLIDAWVKAADAFLSVFQIGDPKEAMIHLHTDTYQRRTF